ncbi:hypothetical protein B0H19DRAFT_1228141 [Mycena capillaripes]|nr:hypothetical protein B0H19DRAFT_1228141 [Mycena capillaripes]
MPFHHFLAFRRYNDWRSGPHLDLMTYKARRLDVVRVVKGRRSLYTALPSICHQSALEIAKIVAQHNSRSLSYNINQISEGEQLPDLNFAGNRSSQRYLVVPETTRTQCLLEGPERKVVSTVVVQQEAMPASATISFKIPFLARQYRLAALKELLAKSWQMTQPVVFALRAAILDPGRVGASSVVLVLGTYLA